MFARRKIGIKERTRDSIRQPIVIPPSHHHRHHHLHALTPTPATHATDLIELVLTPGVHRLAYDGHEALVSAGVLAASGLELPRQLAAWTNVACGCVSAWCECECDVVDMFVRVSAYRSMNWTYPYLGNFPGTCTDLDPGNGCWL